MPIKPGARSSKVNYRAAEQHLSTADRQLAKLIKAIGPCTLRPHSDFFYVLTQTVISQQISGKAATAIGNKFDAVLGRKGRTAKNILSRSDEELRAAGLSASKLRSIREISERVAHRHLDLKAIPKMADEDIAAALLEIHGLGPWSVDMAMIFGLGRLDILPVGDFGFRMGVKELLGLKTPPTPRELEKIAEPWRPYRTVATWYFWRSKGAVPQSD